MKYDIELEKDQGILSRDELLGKVVKCKGYISSKNIFFNGSDKIIVNDKKSYEDFTRLIKDTLFTEFKEHLLSIHLAEFIPGKTVAPFRNGQNQYINNRLSKLAKLSTSNRKTYFNYLTNINNPQKLNSMVKDLVEYILSQPDFLSHISPHICASMPPHLLPCLLLSSRAYLPPQKVNFPSLIHQNIVALSSLKKLKSKNKYIEELVEDTIVLCTDCHAESWMRNYYLSLFKLGTMNDFWLGAITKESIRMQARVIVPDDIMKLANQMPGTGTPTIITSAWSRVSLCTNIRSIKDIPIQLISLFVLASKDTNLDPHKLYMNSILKKYNESHTTKFPLEYFNSKSVHNFFSDWIHSKKSTNSMGQTTDMSDEWIQFFNLFNISSKVSDHHKKTITRPIIEWAISIRNFNSPWDIKVTDLKSPGLSKPDTFYYFIANRQNKNSKTSLTKKTRLGMWNNTAKLFQDVINDLILEDIQQINPFKNLGHVSFKGVTTTTKTHRRRICQSGIDVMLEILYSPNEAGEPTYQWVKDRSKTISVSGTDHILIWDKDKKDHISVFSPSRTNALILLLLLPLRGVQVRWLDQGNLDEFIYSPELKKVVDNSDKMEFWKHELQYDHFDTAGCNTGLIQLVEDLYTPGNKEFNIYINSNKTQLWDPESRDGYFIPWPYTEDDSEKSRILNRPYDLIFEQQKWVNKYCPDQTPISYLHINEDRGRVTDSGNVLANTPFFTPLFTDISAPITYERNGKMYHAFAPISKKKIVTLFKDVCIEANKRCIAQSLPYRFTKKDNSPIFDIHSLRVAGISNLIEAGVPIHIVSEFVAGHQTVVMTLSYFKTLSSEVREHLIKKWEESPGQSGFESVCNYISENKGVNLHTSNGENVNIVTEDLATMVPVEGGLCPLGGKGCEGCKKGMRSFETKNTDEMKEVYVSVKGGCGNCIFWLTGEDFIFEQILELNRLMFKMRSEGKEILELQNTKSDIEWDIEETECVKEKTKLTMRKMNLVDNINSREEALTPSLMAWSNRYQAIELSKSLALDSNENKLTLFGDTSIEALKSELEMSSDFDLARTIVEQATILPRHATPIPKDASIMLRESMDKIMANIGSPGLIAQIPNEALATKTASALARAINDICSKEDVEAVLEGRANMNLSDNDKNGLNELAASIKSNTEALQNNTKRVGSTHE